MKFERTRIAPTPSGFLHLGNVLSFAVTIELARKTGASVLLRIDDIDQERYQDEYVHDIFDTLDFLELPWDEGPRSLAQFQNQYSHIHRLPLYERALHHLQATGKVFACTCSRSQLQHANGIYTGTCIEQQHALHKQDANWRLHTDNADTITIKTLEHKPVTTTLPHQMQHMVVKKKDQKPAYQLASVIDDLHFGVDLIIRGNDLWPSTVAQLHLAGQLPPNDFHQCTFYHHALLTNVDGKKLSKSAGATSVRYLRKQGIKKEEVYKTIARLMQIPDTDIYDCRSLAAAFLSEAFTKLNPVHTNGELK